MRLAATLALVLSLALGPLMAGCSRAQNDPAFDAKVRAYLLAHPEIIEEMVTKLEEKKAAQAQAKLQAALKEKRAAIERDPRDFVANPKGAITVTEFYDYRCPHCINSAKDVMEIVQTSPDVRVVFKEFPIFGDVSDHAAIAAIAVQRMGGDYLGVWRDFMAAKPLDAAAIERVLKAHNVDPKAAEAHTADAKKQIEDTHKLALDLAIDGTPAFIIGDTLVPGRDMDAVKKAIEAQRGKAKG